MVEEGLLVICACIIPAWDNTPRRGNRAHIVIKPRLRCTKLATEACRADPGISPCPRAANIYYAWNEWAEGTRA